MSRRSARRYGFFAALALATLVGAGAVVMGRVPARNTDVPANGVGDRRTPSPAASRASAIFAPSRSFATTRAVAGVRGAPVATTPRGEVIADELVVRPGADTRATEQAIAAAGGRIAWRAPRTGLLLVRFASAADMRVARGQLGSDRRVGGIFENRIMEGASLPTTASEARAVQWHLAAMKAPASRSAAGVTVAVLDSGVAYEAYSDTSGSYAKAPDLAATSFAAGWDFINDDAHPNDDHGHGTHVSALIAGSEPVPGVGVGATILPVKVLDAGNLGTELGLAEGLRYAVDHGADVVNMSLSFQAGFFPSRYLQDAVDHASAHGVVLVAAAGNQGGNAVSYPAAFREVIAVGASRIWDQYRSPASAPWQAVEQYLRRAEYSNRGFRLDVVAPGGGLDGDTNLDGAPDTVVAQTIVPGQPTQFEYRLWAGTSQAAAQVSGVVALMLAADPSLSAADIRSILGETAAPEAGGVVLSSLVGRGFLRVDAALAAVAAGTAERPRFAAAVRVALVAPGGVRRGRATVEVLDSTGAPVASAQVYGTFTGGAFAVQHGVTGADGTATFLSPDLGTAPVVAFQVDAVSTGSGPGQAFDRPSGAIKIDSCSLQLLSEYAEGSGLGSSPVSEGPSTGTGLGSSPGDSDGGNTGSGLGSSPDDPVGGSGFGSSPDDPRDLVGGSGLGSSPDPRDLVGGAGFGSSPDDPDNLTGGAGLGSSPMCANLLGDCAGLASNGQGLGSSPVTQGAGGSFAGETPSLVGSHERLLALRMPTLGDEVDAVALLNLSWSGSTVPMVVAADAAWFATAFPDSPVVQALGQGLGSSPLALDPVVSFTPALAALPDNAGCTPLVVTTFATGDVATGAPAVAVEPSSCSTPTSCEQRAVAVESVWGWASGAGLGSSPRAPRPQWSAATGWPEGEYNRLVAALDVWSTFAMSPGGSAAAAYDELLVGSGLDSTGETFAPAVDGASCGPDLYGDQPSPSLVADPAALGVVCTSGDAP
jgi:hypothetical protein